jgi:undecaprenyl-diphosphatase
LDEQLLLAVNQGWASTGLDFFFAWISARQAFSIPLLLLVLVFFSWRFGRDGAKFWFLMILLVALGDVLGSIFKSIAAQPRPCAELGEVVRTVTTVFFVNCSHNLNGMPSNHALNFFLFASFTGVVLRWRGWVIGFLLLAALVALSRVYLGVHYPSQILAGTILGIMLGAGSGLVALRYIPLVQRVHSSTLSR